MNDDLSLLSRYHHQGDARAFQALVETHGGMVFATARRITQDAALAEEVAQDTFLALARRGQSIRQSVTAWLHHVARQKAANVVRGKVRRARHEQEAATILHDGQESSWREIEPVVDEVLGELPEEVRGLLIEQYLERRTQSEIAKSRGLSQSTVSRRIDSGLQRLRDGLRARGITCGSGLAALLLSNATQAAPASLAASMSKLGLSGIGSGLPSGLASTMGTTGLAAISFKGLVAILAAIVAVGVVGYDLASRDSRLARWLAFGRDQQVVLLAKDQPKAVSVTALSTGNEERWAAEAREIWANAPKVDAMEVYNAGLYFENENRDAAKYYEMLHSVGMKISRAAFDRVMKEREAALEQRANFLLWDKMKRAWIDEAPREALAWTYHINDPIWKTNRMEAVSQLLSRATDAIRREPGAWAAFLAASPDPRIAKHSEVWLREADDPGIIWSKAGEISLSISGLASHATGMVLNDTPARALQVLQRCPDKVIRERCILGLAPRLDGENLLQLAGDDFAGEPGLANLLRAMAGDAGASFEEALTWALETAKREGYYRTESVWLEECMRKVYAHWLKADPAAGFGQIQASGKQEHLERFMMEAARTGSLSEQDVFDLLAEAKPVKRDEALASYYRSLAAHDPEETLRLIAQSEFIEDQVRAAKPVLSDWAESRPEAAIAWLEDLPTGENKVELVAAIVTGWMEGKPGVVEAAIEFALGHGVRLADYSGALAYSIRNEKEAAIAEIVNPLRGDEHFNLLIVRTAAYGMGTFPSLQFMARQAEEGWQNALVGEVIRWFKVGDCRADEYALALPTQDLRGVPAGRLVKLAESLVPQLNGEGKLRQALDWTLRLPSSAAPGARAAALAHLDLNDAALRANLSRWISHAPIQGEERKALLQRLAQ